MGLAVTLLAGGILAAASFGSDSSVGDSDTLHGLAVLIDEPGDVTGSWDQCEGTGGYDDFSAGAALSVKGKEGEIVGSGSVENVSESKLATIVEMDWAHGDLVGLEETDDKEAAISELRDFFEETEGFACVLYFEADIEDSSYYSVELSDRGELNWSREELQEHGYVVNISLGM